MSRPTVATIRARLEADGQLEEFTTREGRDGRRRRVRQKRTDGDLGRYLRQLTTYLKEQLPSPPGMSPTRVRETIRAAAGNGEGLEWADAVRRVHHFLGVALDALKPAPPSVAGDAAGEGEP